MPRRRRVTGSGVIFHVVNRSSRKGPLFESVGDYHAFEMILRAGVTRFGVQILAYCLMPNHWHFVILPPVGHTLSRFMHWLTTTHARRWRLQTRSEGEGAVYQGRFKAIPVEADRHLLWVLRYVERNACRASLVDRAEDWPWCSLWQREHNSTAAWLAPWPVSRPANWLEHVNCPQTASELEAFRRLMHAGDPFGEGEWQRRVLADTGRRSGRRRGRPPKTVLVK